MCFLNKQKGHKVIMSNESNETALALPQSGELVSGQVARAQAEIQAAYVMAHHHPRDEDSALSLITQAVLKPFLAEKAVYSYPRGSSTVSGPSVYLAREAARVWRNIQHGFHVVHEDDEWVQIRAYARDLETNELVEQDDRFKKLIQRKKGKGENATTVWIKPDERDLRELRNRRGAIAQRNCVLQILPRHFVDQAVEAARKASVESAAAQLDLEREKIIAAFGSFRIPPKEIEAYLGHGLRDITPAEVAELREIYASLRDGVARWPEYVEARQAERNPKKPAEKESAGLTACKVEPETRENLQKNREEEKKRTHWEVCRDVLVEFVDDSVQLTTAELADMIGDPVQMVQVAIADLILAGSLYEPTGGVYAIPSADGPEAEPEAEPQEGGDSEPVDDDQSAAKVVRTSACEAALAALKTAERITDIRNIRRDAFAAGVDEGEKRLIREGFRAAEARIRGSSDDAQTL